MGMNKLEVLKKTFGYDSFRPGQEELIDGILAGRDVLGIMRCRLFFCPVSPSWSRPSSPS